MFFFFHPVNEHVECSADVRAMQLVENEYAELELSSSQVCFLPRIAMSEIISFLLLEVAQA